MHFSKFSAILTTLLFLFLLAPSLVSAEDFKYVYKVDYFLSDSQGTIKTRARFNVDVTSFTSESYIRKFSLTFPKIFSVHNEVGSYIGTHNGKVLPLRIEIDDVNTKVIMEIPDPDIGKDKVSNLSLEFDQDNLFKTNGNVWEVILPILNRTPGSDYQITVHLPQNTDKKISIAKPKPDAIDGNQIIWKNPDTKTIYAVFGDKQFYLMKLNYHLKNEKAFKGYTDIAFPPDTQFQKMYVNSINPPPEEVIRDEDGNYLGRYYLKSNEKKDITFDGVVELSTQPRDDIQPIIKKQFEKQRDYLLNSNKYWDLQEGTKLQTKEDIYRYIVGIFKYNYQRVSNKTERKGAQYALANPQDAICTEFSDAFVGLAREQGIYSREVQGYGFSSDPQLRPLSLQADVLHSWPEYYDTDTALWNPIDPTWENTSGIDYFSSFDLNHIVFALHGKDAEQPYPAGSYKYENTKDVSVVAISTPPEEKGELAVSSFPFEKTILDTKKYTSTLTLQNKSNVYLWNVSIDISGQNISTSIKTKVIDSIAPYEKVEIPIEYKSDLKNKKDTATISITSAGKQLYFGSTTVLPYYYQVGTIMFYIVSAVAVILFFSKLLVKIYRK